MFTEMEEIHFDLLIGQDGRVLMAGEGYALARLRRNSKYRQIYA